MFIIFVSDAKIFPIYAIHVRTKHKNRDKFLLTSVFIIVFCESLLFRILVKERDGHGLGEPSEKTSPKHIICLNPCFKRTWSRR